MEGAKIHLGLPSRERCQLRLPVAGNWTHRAGTGRACGHLQPVPSLFGQDPDVLVVPAVALSLALVGLGFDQ